MAQIPGVINFLLMVRKIILLSAVFCLYSSKSCRASNSADESSNLNYFNDFAFEEDLASLYSIPNSQLDVFESVCDHAFKRKNFEPAGQRSFKSFVDDNLKEIEEINLELSEGWIDENVSPCPHRLEDYAPIDGCRCANDVFDESEQEEEVEIEVPVGKKPPRRSDRDRNKERGSRYRLMTKEHQSQILAELERILKLQLGQEAVFKLSDYKILNWPKDVEKNKGQRTKVECNKIKSKMSELVFVPLRHEFINPQMQTVSSRNYSDELQHRTFEEVKRKCKGQLPLEDCEDLYKYEIYNWPEGIVRIKKYWDVAECEAISRELGKFTFAPLGSISGREYYLNMKTKLNEDLRTVFLSQHPDKRFNLKAFDIENWPSDVPVIKSSSWNMSEIGKINCKLADLVFIERDSSPTYTEPSGSDASDANLIKSWNKKQVYALLLERFRLETGNPTAKAIDWSKLNCRDIPIQYGRYKINCVSMKNEKFYKNREIVDNIHFFKDSVKPSNKRRWETETSAQSDDCAVNRKK